MHPSTFCTNEYNQPLERRMTSGSKKDSEGDKDKSRTNTQDRKSTNSAYDSSSSGDGRISGSFLEWLMTDNNHESPEPVSGENSDEDLPTNHSIRYIERAAPKQQGDLLGLNPHALNDGSPDNETKVVSTSSQETYEETVATCTVHKALLTKWHKNAISNGLPESRIKTLSKPMDRFLSEGKAERYALLSIDQTGKDQAWRRYSGCHCWKEVAGDRD